MIRVTAWLCQVLRSTVLIVVALYVLPIALLAFGVVYFTVRGLRALDRALSWVLR